MIWCKVWLKIGKFKDVKEYCSEDIFDASVNFKIKQTFALDDFPEIYADSERNAGFENLGLNWSVWVYDSVASMTIDPFKGMRKHGISYIELPIQFLSIWNIQNKIDNGCGFWWIPAHLHPVKTNIWRTIGFEKSFDKTITTSMNVESGIMSKNVLELETFSA